MAASRTFSGGQVSSATPHSPYASQLPALSMTLLPFLMPAQGLELASSLASNGRPGHCTQDGTLMGGTLDGLKALDSNSWSDTSSPLAPPTFISKFSETTEVWLRAGGTDTVGINPQMTPSNAFIPSWMKQTALSSLDTFPVEKTQPMDPSMVFIPPHISVFQSSSSPMPSSHSSATSQRTVFHPTTVCPSNNRFQSGQVPPSIGTLPSSSASEQTVSRRCTRTTP